jgi:hypothetical protein
VLQEHGAQFKRIAGVGVQPFDFTIDSTAAEQLYQRGRSAATQYLATTR